MWHTVYSVLYHLTQLCALWLWLFHSDFTTYKLQARVGNRPSLQRGQTAGGPLGAGGLGLSLWSDRTHREYGNVLRSCED